MTQKDLYHSIGRNSLITFVVLIEHLKNFIQDQELDLARLKNGHSVGRPRKRKNVERDAKICQAQTDLASGR